MDDRLRFVLAGGGTGGHVVPALAVARELVKHGHEVLFVGSKSGMEAKLVPEAGFAIQWIEIGGLNRVGWLRFLKSALQLPVAVLAAWRLLGRFRPEAVFSMGGYVAGPVVAASILRGTPVVSMEPNAIPGFTNRVAGRYCARMLVNHPASLRFFPEGLAEVVGYPVREEFFRVMPKPIGEKFSVLITGGSQGSRRLNLAFEASWPLFRESELPVRFLHQPGKAMFEEMRDGFAASGLRGEIVAFINDMPGAFAEADVVVCRSGAGAVSELAAAGKASVLIPFPYAADDHQLENAQVMERAGAAKIVTDAEWTGTRMFKEVSAMAADPDTPRAMGEAARRLALPGAAERAAKILEDIARKGLTRGA
jgi:UDP-N-acetylglucosamine--N-acetylmuramyl-(pentapeptide) pyrophosphoryl-undecaprenol N-acetylglucosamine transferase